MNLTDEEHKEQRNIEHAVILSLEALHGKKVVLAKFNFVKELQAINKQFADYPDFPLDLQYLIQYNTSWNQELVAFNDVQKRRKNMDDMIEWDKKQEARKNKKKQAE